jgi:hypothetical protein
MVLTSLYIVKYQYHQQPYLEGTAMNPIPEYLAAVQQEREREAVSAHLARVAARFRACRNPTRVDRLVRAVRGPRTTC